jgi:hypothetical protein
MKKYLLVLFAVLLQVAHSSNAEALNFSVSGGQSCLKSQIGLISKSNGKTFVCKKTSRGQVWRLTNQDSKVATGPTSTSSTSTTSATPKTFTGNTTWGVVTLTAITPPDQGQCSEIPIRIDIRGKVGLEFGLIVSAEDPYQNKVGEMTRLTTDQQLSIGITDYTIKVCRDPWILTYTSGVTLQLNAVKYCGLNIKFFPYQKPISYLFAGC